MHTAASGARPRSVDEWLRYQEQTHSLAIDLGLERIKIVLARLGLPPPSVPVITVAGTNGKGSVASYCSAVLQAAGLRSGLFTSPHLLDYRERICIAGRWVEERELLDAFERIEAARGDVTITFFEYSTLAALLLFDRSRLDVYILEVGLGGRLDAVNVIDADVSVIVSIGLDHQSYLGADVESIGREKAGIFRPGRIAVLGNEIMPASIARTARAMGATLKRLGREFSYVCEPSGRWSYRGSAWRFDDLPPPALFGTVQYANAATALAALEAVEQRLPVGLPAIAQGLTGMTLAGRFERIQPRAGGVSWILDVAHNPDAASVLARNLQATRGRGRTLAVFGILADKDAQAIAASIAAQIDEWFLCSTAGERGVAAAALHARVDGLISGNVTLCDCIENACERASRAALDADRIVVLGSFLVVGPARLWISQSRA